MAFSCNRFLKISVAGEEDSMDEKKEKKKLNNFLEICLYLFLSAALTYFILAFVGQRTSVYGSSMYPALSDGDQLIVEKISYRFGEPKRFDIIVFNEVEDGKEETVHYIKRVIGLPGETVNITDGKIYIDGQELSEDYGYYLDQKEMEGYDFSEPVLIGEDEYFVLGDNRNDSLDSRKIGCINKKDIIGKAVFRIYPFQTFGGIQ